MIVRGVVVNGGWVNEDQRTELLIRISVSELADASGCVPSRLRNRSAVIVLGDPPSISVDDLPISLPDGVNPALGETTPATVVENEHGP